MLVVFHASYAAIGGFYAVHTRKLALVPRWWHRERNQKISICVIAVDL